MKLAYVVERSRIRGFIVDSGTTLSYGNLITHFMLFTNRIIYFSSYLYTLRIWVNDTGFP